MNTYKERIILFQQKMKSAMMIMEEQKRQLKNMQVVREKQDKAQADLL